MQDNNFSNLWQRDKLSGYLPWVAFNPNKQLYWNQDNTAGFMLELNPVPFAGEGVIGALTSIYDLAWPKGTIIQTILYADPNMQSILDEFTARRGSEYDFGHNSTREFLRLWAKDYAGFLAEQSRTTNKTVPVPFRNFRVFFTAKSPCKAGEFCKDAHILDKLMSFRENIQGQLQTHNIHSYSVKPALLVQLMRQTFNPGLPYEKEELYNPNQCIANQIISSETRIRQGIRSLRSNNHHIACLTPGFYANSPTSYNSNLLIGDMGVSNMRQIISPFMITLTIHVTDVDKKIRDKSSVILAQSTKFSTAAPRLQNQQEEFRRAISMMENQKRFLNGYLTLTIFETSPKRLKKSVSVAKSLWEQCGYKLQEELWITLPLFLAAQPFGLYEQSIPAINRMLPAPSQTWALLSPVQADWRGTPTPVYLFISRRGQVNTLNFMDSDTNYNAIVAAESGSGKSFLLNYLTTNTLSVGGRAFIIDVGRSYEKLCQQLKGQFLAFTRDCGISLNVFANLTYEHLHSDNTDIELDNMLNLYTRLLAQMANPTTKISDLENKILKTVIVSAYSKLKPDEYMSIDRFVDELVTNQSEYDALGKQEHTAGQLASKLKPYCEDGIYGRWFKGAINIEFNNDFVVLELEELNSDPELREVVLLLLISVIDQTLFFGDRSKSSLIIIDEAWDLLGGANTGAFIETGFRRARKYGGSFVVATQGINDFFNEKSKEVGNAILANSAFQILLKQKPEEVERLSKEKKLVMSDFEKDLLKGVHTLSGQYSEALIRTGSGAFSVCRLYAPRYSQLLFTTKPQEVQRLANIEQAGHTLDEAIKVHDAVARYEQNMPFTEALAKAMSKETETE